MNNLSGNIEYSLQQYAAMTQAQLLNTTPLRQPRTVAPSQNIPMQDPTAFHLAYSPFPLIRMAPPQLHQPTLATKELTHSPVNKTDEGTHEKPKAPVRVTRPPNAYLLFNKEMRKILKDQDPTMKVADISKEVGFRWKTMPKEQKDQYVIQANKLKEEQKALHPNAMYMRRSRAELVKAGHVTKGSSKDQPKRKRPKRDKNASTPKHPLSAYMWYLTEVRPETMRNYPGSNVGQISKLCADRWNNMTEEDRLPWKTKAQVDKERYAREMQIYAIQNDHALGRGTRQKYRAAALKHELSSFMDPFYKTIQPPSSLQPSLLINTQPLSPSNSMLLPMNHTPRTLNTLLPSDPFVNNNC